MKKSTKELILIPSIITLAVTLLRLIGEVQGWSAGLFSNEAGGGLALVGISWLAPVFGIYFALELSRTGTGPGESGWKVALWGLLSLLAVVAGLILVGLLVSPGPLNIAASGIVALGLAFFLLRNHWKELQSVLLAYGLAARVPVVVVAFIAMWADWGTHYEKGPPGFPELSFWPKWLSLGLAPQLTLWIAFTLIAGTIFGGVAVALRRSSAA